MNRIECGKVLNTHGIRGEVKAEIYCDPPLFRKLKTVDIGGRAYAVQAARSHGSFFLLTLEGVDTVEAAMPLKGKLITAPRASFPLKKGEYLLQDIYGFAVYDARREMVIGTLAEVLERPASMLYRVESEKGEILIPAVPPF